MKKIKAVIFDWAGTTVDYGCMAPVQAFVEVFKQYGIEPTMEEVRKPMGMLKIDHIRTMLQMERIRNLWVEKYGKEPGEEEAQALYSIFEEKLLSILPDHSGVKPGVVETVDRLRRNGIVIGSSEMGLTEEEYNALAPEEQKKRCSEVSDRFLAAGADKIFYTMEDLGAFLLG